MTFCAAGNDSSIPSKAPGPPGPPGCEVRAVPSKGYGLFPSAACTPGVQVFTDKPLFIMQHTGNRRLVAVCANCCAFVGSLQQQLEVIFGEARFGPMLAEVGEFVQRWDAELLARNSKEAGDVIGVRCSQGCGELYCSQACRDAHFLHSHNLLCVGPIQNEDHPLPRFKYHALQHADTLLLVAQVFAHLINRAKSMGGGVAAMRGLMMELLVFCNAPFGEACRPPPGRQKDAEFAVHVEGLVNEAAALLRASLALHAPVETTALFEGGAEFFSRVLGLFEYNNIDVEVQSPLGQVMLDKARELAATASSSAQAAADLAKYERLLREKEWVMQCTWGEETTGVYGDDLVDTDNASGNAEAMLEVDASMDASGEATGEDFNAGVADAAMAQARAAVNKMSLDELVNARWPSLHGTAFYPSAARINHSCNPNMKIEFPWNSANLTAVTLRPVAAGEELCISYIKHEADVSTRRRQLLEYGFVCSCERCLQEDSGSVRRTQKRLK